MVFFKFSDSVSNKVVCVVTMDDSTGITYKEALTVPGEFGNMIGNSEVQIKFGKLEGTVDHYRTSMYALYVEDQNSIPDAVDLTDEITKLISLPETAIKAMSSRYQEDIWELIRTSLDAIHYYEGITRETRVTLPASIEGLSEEEKGSMLSQRANYSLKSSENQSVFQKAFDAPFNVRLPQLDAIHRNSDDLITALDIIRVLAPYRKAEGGNHFSYKSIYHTPYYKVDVRIRGMVPSHLSWINGVSVNDTLEIQANERQFYNNLHTLVYADISRYTAEMASGVFFDTALGTAISKLCLKRDSEVIQQIIKDISEASSDKASCDLQFSEVESLIDNGWYIPDVIQVIKSKLRLTPGYLQELVSNRSSDRHIIDTETIPFVISIKDDEEQALTDIFINQGYMTNAMYRFLQNLATAIYRVSWGHTGATKAIPGFILKSALADVDSSMESYMDSVLSGNVPNSADYPMLYLNSSPSDDEDIMDFTGDPDEISHRFDYYVTDETLAFIKAGSLDPAYFNTIRGKDIVQSRDASIVEYIRVVNGEANLDEYIYGVYLHTGSISKMIELIIKLMRWGQRRPRVLVANDVSYRYAFDLNSGLRVDNTAVVDESQLIKVNGCEYSYVGCFSSSSNPGIDPTHIVGFVFQKDYGVTKKYYLASWLDLAEMTVPGEIKIGNFTSVIPLTLDASNATIEALSKEEHQIFLSDSAIKEGLKLKISPKDLSPISALCVEGVMNTMGYLQSLKNEVMITSKDRQYENLRRYTKALQYFYSQNTAELTSVSNSLDISNLAALFKQIYDKESYKQDANSATAAKTISKLNLGPASKVQWDTSELSGQFYIISDVDMNSNLPPIQFTDEKVKTIAERVRNRIVMLLLHSDNKFIFCRKDITPGEIVQVPSKKPDGTPTRKLGHKAYAPFGPAIKRLLDGSPTTINGVPAVLHESLKEFL